ncbi:sensor histidine kinase [Ramlibacter tataouinensis]|uniref:sensor histidine kinase n=1 Tax=Ramlibacter tataouinensis TaxID=94132 RepID=UPI000777DB50|nr:ATP-binding protein [Ramlibacter tataouinensis]
MDSNLRRSEERCRLALDAARALVYELMPDGSIAAHGLERVTGYRPEDLELTLDWWYSLIHPSDLALHRQRIARVMEAGGSYSATYRIRRKDGEWIWVEATAEVFKDGPDGAVRVVGALVDITERQRATEALRESEQRLRSLHALSGRLLAARLLDEALEDLLDCAIQICHASFGNVQLFNTKVEALEIVAQRGFRRPFLDHFRAVHVHEGSACAQVLQSGQQLMIEDVELDAEFAPHRAVAAEAGYRSVLSTPLTAYQGNVVGMLSVHFKEPHSVSPQDRQVVDILARHGADLVARLRFEQALRDAERYKDEFLAMLAHELRNPLAPIANSLKILKLDPGNTAFVAQARKTMERQVSQLTRLVDDLLDVSRIASHKLELRMENLELASVAQYAAESCQPLIDRRSQTLTIELPNEPIRLHADPVRLGQVFCNLITNASKYSGEGGDILLIAERDRDQVAVSVRDNGCGIAPELLPRVFDLFMQVDGRSERSGGGLGLGLPLVKRLVEMHGGTVSAQSDGIGLGSRFIVRLPLAAEPGPQSQLEVPTSTAL